MVFLQMAGLLIAKAHQQSPQSETDAQKQKMNAFTSITYVAPIGMGSWASLLLWMTKGENQTKDTSKRADVAQSYFLRDLPATFLIPSSLSC